MKTKTVLTLLMLGASALIANAQDAGNPPPDAQPPGRQMPGGPGMRGHRPPPCPLARALDANHDGVIDADEIANASAALKALDKNGDGQLTPDEFAPPRPPRRAGRPDNGGANQAPPPGN